jgi:hypothetical protein
MLENKKAPLKGLELFKFATYFLGWPLDALGFEL